MSQSERILNYLETHKSITQREAAEMFGCWRLGARIWDLRRSGRPIERVIERGVNQEGEPCHYARYFLLQKREAER